MEHYAKFDVHAAQQHVAPAVLGFFRSVALGQASGTRPSTALLVAFQLVPAAFRYKGPQIGCLSAGLPVDFWYRGPQIGCLSAGTRCLSVSQIGYLSAGTRCPALSSISHWLPFSCLLADMILLPDFPLFVLLPVVTFS